MKEIKEIKVYFYPPESDFGRVFIEMDAILIREDNPRLCIVQDRIAMIGIDNVIHASVDLLTLFK